MSTHIGTKRTECVYVLWIKIPLRHWNDVIQRRSGLVFPFTIYQSSVITAVTVKSGITTLIGRNEQFDVLTSLGVFLRIAQFPESPETAGVWCMHCVFDRPYVEHRRGMNGIISSNTHGTISISWFYAAHVRFLSPGINNRVLICRKKKQ